MYKLDLHTHSYGSPDGGLQTGAYRAMLEHGQLDIIAITDHNDIAAAQSIQTALDPLGERIIVGEEIMTTEGELIGLYLSQTVPAGLSPLETVRQIRAQGGLVYVPHPFETVRSGLSVSALDAIAELVDIVEVHNGRAVFQNKGSEAAAWAKNHHKPGAASSDAHGRAGWGRTYAVVDRVPTRGTLLALLAQARLGTGTVGVGVVYPKLHRLKKGLRGKH